jgi:hypothetical protein
MQGLKPRPILHSFRALAFQGENRGDATGVEMSLELRQDISLGLAVPTVAGGAIQVAVLLNLSVIASNEKSKQKPATFAGEYEAKFYFPFDTPEETVKPLMEDSDYQYGLVAQAYPLAMTHFRRELQSMGLDARELPLGLAYPSE